jgi:hypothetical protein
MIFIKDYPVRVYEGDSQLTSMPALTSELTMGVNGDLRQGSGQTG